MEQSYKPPYSEYDTETTTHLTRAVNDRIHKNIAVHLRRNQGNTPTEAQVEEWIDNEWQDAKKSSEYWKGIRRKESEARKTLAVSDRVLRRVRDDDPEIPDTLHMSNLAGVWKRVRDEKEE